MGGSRTRRQGDPPQPELGPSLQFRTSPSHRESGRRDWHCCQRVGRHGTLDCLRPGLPWTPHEPPRAQGLAPARIHDLYMQNLRAIIQRLEGAEGAGGEHSGEVGWAQGGMASPGKQLVPEPR